MAWGAHRRAVEGGLTQAQRDRLARLLWKLGRPATGEERKATDDGWLPWDEIPFSRWGSKGKLDDRYVALRADLQPNDPNACWIFGPWPEVGDKWEVDAVTHWFAQALQRHRWQPFAAALVALRAEEEIARNAARDFSEIMSRMNKGPSPFVTLGLIGAASAVTYYAWKAGWFVKLWR